MQNQNGSISFDAIKEMETKPENKKPWITVKPRFTDIRLIRTLHCYGQFALSLGKESPYIFLKFNPLNTDTPSIWTLFGVR